MTENPYAPPSADLASGDNLGDQGGTGDFEIGQCVSDAWAATWENFPLWLGFGLAFTVLALLATVTIVGMILALPHLVFGSIYFVLRMHDGEAEFGDLFAGFSDYGRVLVNVLVMGLIMMLLGLIAQSLQYVGTFTENGLLTGIGGIISLAYTLLVTPRLYFAYFYLVDQDATGVESLRLAWERTNVSKWKCLGLMLLTFAILIVGALALLVGMIPAAAMGYLMWASAYRQIEGRAATV